MTEKQNEGTIEHPANSGTGGCDGTEPFCIQFEDGQVRFGLWPRDLAETIGLKAIVTWKTCYAEQGVPDAMSCGTIVDVGLDSITIQFGHTKMGAPVSSAFLIPNAKVERQITPQEGRG
ncbi:MAG: hypothetical protein EOM20_03270 [Spartobacteria bacterium]|nr:hypothetical protein [Spartobacteria bacterium]